MASNSTTHAPAAPPSTTAAPTTAPSTPPVTTQPATPPAPAAPAPDGPTTTGAISGSILKGGRFYKAGEEAKLSAVLSQSDMDRHVESGALTGSWVSTAAPIATNPTPRASRRGR